jgi:hypothetical protein
LKGGTLKRATFIVRGIRLVAASEEGVEEDISANNKTKKSFSGF